MVTLGVKPQEVGASVENIMAEILRGSERDRSNNG